MIIYTQQPLFCPPQFVLAENNEEYACLSQSRLTEIMIRLSLEIGLEFYLVKKNGYLDESTYRFLNGKITELRDLLEMLKSKNRPD